MTTGRARLAASILDADQADLGRAVRRAVRGGADRIHLDVMDGNFVPNITFGPKMIGALRRHTEAPFDAHLMIAEPSRYIDEFIDAGCDSITFHVEVEEPIEPTLRAIRAAGRAAGLSLRPGTPLSALQPYAPLLDIVMVMTVEPGFGGQSFMREVAREKVFAARSLLAHKPVGGEVHVDGGVNRESAELLGGLAADVLVVGSVLWVKGHDIAREIRLVKALADEGFQYQRNDGRPPIPVDRWTTVATLPQAFARRLAAGIEAEGVPVLLLRGEGRIGPDGVRDYDVLVPATAESLVVDRFAAERSRAEADADAWRASFAPDGTGGADGRPGVGTSSGPRGGPRPGPA